MFYKWGETKSQVSSINKICLDHKTGIRRLFKLFANFYYGVESKIQRRVTTTANSCFDFEDHNLYRYIKKKKEDISWVVYTVPVCMVYLRTDLRMASLVR